MSMLSQPFTSFLQSGRTELNRRFAEAKHTFPELNADAFARCLQSCADPLVQAVSAVAPLQVTQAAGAAYDAALELVGQNLAGSVTGENRMEEGWRRILVPSARLVAEAPVRAIASVCNAIHQLQKTPGARTGQWIAEMEALTPNCGDLESLLTVGQVAAWRAGLAHYRETALVAADSLPAPLALRAVAAPANANWPQVRDRLRADPWFDPSAAAQQNRIRLVAQAGTFRGFGGFFAQPPTVACHQQQIFVRCDAEAWLLTADCFGATFHRATPEEFEVAKAHASLPKGMQLRRDTVLYRNYGAPFPPAGEVTSAAATAGTLAVTFRLTHTILLFALPS